MTKPDHRLENLASTFPAGAASTTIPQAVPDSVDEVQFYFGFQAGSHYAPVQQEVVPRVLARAALLQRMREVSKTSPPPARTPGAGDKLAQETQEWAPTRRRATAAMLGDDEPQ